MKRIYEVFTDKEFEAINKAKTRAKMTWHDFILKLADYEDGFKEG